MKYKELKLKVEDGENFLRVKNEDGEVFIEVNKTFHSIIIDEQYAPGKIRHWRKRDVNLIDSISSNLYCDD